MYIVLSSHLNGKACKEVKCKDTTYNHHKNNLRDANRCTIAPEHLAVDLADVEGSKLLTVPLAEELEPETEVSPELESAAALAETEAWDKITVQVEAAALKVIVAEPSKEQAFEV